MINIPVPNDLLESYAKFNHPRRSCAGLAGKAKKPLKYGSCDTVPLQADFSYTSHGMVSSSRLSISRTSAVMHSRFVKSRTNLRIGLI